MITQEELCSYLHQLLQCELYTDYAPNGLQVEGKKQIQRICTAVTASEEVISRAIDWQADALVVHHGYFWRGESSVITGMKKQRLQKLLQHNINLLAYHLPLDCHLEFGNNACLAKCLEIHTVKTHCAGNTDHLLWSGSLKQPMSAIELAHTIEQQLNRVPIFIEGHDRPIHHIAWCSGGAQDFIEAANRLNVDAYVSGEISERTYYQAKELKINYYAAGHHATERLGIQALGKHLSSHFQLAYHFVDTHNPI